MMKFGLLDTEIENIHKIFSQNQEIEKVIIFGSRAKGNYRNNSDIDLVIFGNINLRILNQINIDLDNVVTHKVIGILKMNRMPMTQHKFNLISSAIATNIISKG